MRIIQTILVFTVIASAISDCFDDPLCRSCRATMDDPPAYFCDGCYHSFWNFKAKKCDAKVPQKVANCAVYAEHHQGVYCDKCELGYDLVDNTCQKCKVENCSICPYGASDCKACFNGLIPVWLDNPIKLVCTDAKKCGIENCSMCVEDYGEWCYLCKDGFASSSSNQKCVPSTPNCRIVDSSPNVCSICRDGFYITKDGQCKPSPAYNPLSSLILSFKQLKAPRRSNDKLSAVPL